jgi:hypothetical protein
MCEINLAYYLRKGTIDITHVNYIFECLAYGRGIKSQYKSHDLSAKGEYPLLAGYGSVRLIPNSDEIKLIYHPGTIKMFLLCIAPNSIIYRNMSQILKDRKELGKQDWT